jgi:hypothetical protein
MSFWKSLFCEHEYKFYYKEKEYGPGRLQPDMRFYFVCPKCKKQISLLDRDIKEVYNEFSHEAALQQALAPEALPSISFSVPYAISYGTAIIFMTGHAAYLTKEHFLKQGIDVTHLND